jgi:hypothetical protein
MYHLATAIPAVRRLRVPISRDQAFMLIAAFNELMLAAETYLAHKVSGTIVFNEWIPIIFGVIAAVLLGIAGLISLRNRLLAVWIAVPTLLTSLVVGLLGAYFHLHRALQPFAGAGEQVNVPLVIWGPPFLAPLTFALIAIIGLSAIWKESPVDSGALALTDSYRLQLPYSKTRGYFFLVSLGMLATLISSVLDHARTDFSNPWLWVPTAAGVLGTVVALFIGFIERPTRLDIWIYLGSMLTIMLVGILGVLLHIQTDLGGEKVLVIERVIRGAPILAPMLFADIALLGLLVLLDPQENTARVAPGHEQEIMEKS